MSEQTAIVIIISQSVCAVIEALGMISENMQRQGLGQSMAYSDDAFINLIDKYGLGYNAVANLLIRSQGGQP